MDAQPSTSLDKLRHVVTDAPRVMVVDGSKLVRRLIGDVLQRQLPGARVIACEGVESARAALAAEPDWPVIPMASAFEAMSEARAPLGAYAPRRAVGVAAIAGLWERIERKLEKRR